MKRFTEIACTKQTEFIKAALITKSSLGVWNPIPVTSEEANIQQSETSLTKTQILSIINSLLSSLDESDQFQFQNLSSKSCNELTDILQEISEKY